MNSNENTEPGASLQRALQQEAPNGPNGLEPAPASVWCSRCSVHVIPIDGGRCPHCRSFLPGNAARRTNPVNETRRTAILQQLLREYQPASEAERHQCADLARTLARLEVVSPGKNEHRWLREARDATVRSLNEAREKRAEQPPRDLTRATLDDLREQHRRLGEALDAYDRMEAESAAALQAEAESAASRPVTLPPGPLDAALPALAPSPKPAPEAGATAGEPDEAQEDDEFARRNAEFKRQLFERGSWNLD